MFIQNIDLILNVLAKYNYSDYVVYKIIQIYYTRSQQGLDIVNFIEFLEITIFKDKSIVFDNADDFLRYLQGCIRSYLIDNV